MGRRPANRFTKLLRFQDRKRSPKVDDDAPHVLEMEPSQDWTGEDDSILTSLSSRLDSNRSEGPVMSMKSVRFGECDVRSYAQVLGDHPYCSVGCPLELGWEYECIKHVSVDDYEVQRSERGSRPSAELKLSPQERRDILAAYTDAEIRRACRRMNRFGTQKRVQREFFATAKVHGTV